LFRAKSLGCFFCPLYLSFSLDPLNSTVANALQMLLNISKFGNFFVNVAQFLVSDGELLKNGFVFGQSFLFFFSVDEAQPNHFSNLEIGSSNSFGFFAPVALRRPFVRHGLCAFHNEGDDVTTGSLFEFVVAEKIA
jgi:hypothetical protein